MHQAFKDDILTPAEAKALAAEMCRAFENGGMCTDYDADCHAMDAEQRSDCAAYDRLTGRCPFEEDGV